MTLAENIHPRSGYWLAVFFGIVAAVIESRWPNPGFPAPYVILFAFIMGYLRPARVWRWGLVITVCLVAGSIIRILPIAHWMTFNSIPRFLSLTYAKFGPPRPYPPGPLNDIIAVLPATAAAYLGLWTAEFIHRLRNSHNGAASEDIRHSE